MASDTEILIAVFGGEMGKAWRKTGCALCKETEQGKPFGINAGKEVNILSLSFSGSLLTIAALGIFSVL